LPLVEYEYDEDNARDIGEQVCGLLGIEFKFATIYAFTHWH